MIRKGFVEKRKKNRILLLFTLICIFATESLVFSTSNANQSVYLVVEWIIVLLAIVAFLKYMNDRSFLIGEKATYTLLCVFSIIACMLYNNEFSAGYFLKIAILLLSLSASYYFSLRDFSKKYSQIMYIIATASLILYFMRIINIVPGFLPKLTRIGTGLQFYTIGIANIAVSYSGVLRNPGMFWEPGIYAAYLCVAIIFDLFFQSKIKIKRVVILSLALLSTISTTGYIVYVAILLAFLFDNRVQMKRGYKILLIILLVAILFALLGSEEIFEKLFYKFDANTTGTTLTNRINVLQADFLAIKESPIFGCGFSKSSSILKDYYISAGQKKSFNSINTILGNYSIFGLGTFLLYLYLYFRFIQNFEKNKICKVFITMAFVMLLSSTGYQYSLFFGFVFFLTNDTKELKENAEIEEVIQVSI